MRTAVGHSDQIDSKDAIEDVLLQIEAKIGGEAPKAGVLFASVDYEHAELLERIQDRWPGLPLIGGSSDGEISSVRGFCHDSVLLTVFTGEGFDVMSGLGRELSRDPQAAVRAAVGGLGEEHAGLCITTFAPTTNGSEVVRALDRELGGHAAIVGGLTGDHRESRGRTREFFGGEVLSDSLPVLLLQGEFRCGYGVGSGWFPIGAHHVVTRSDGHLVHEIDHRPALEIYRDYYGTIPNQSLGEYPLAVYVGEDVWSLRAILESEPATGALRFAGEVPEGSTVRITEVMNEGILSGSTESLAAALKHYGGAQPEGALIFSCAARKWVLGTQAQREIDELRACAAALGAPELDIAGLYVFGEICPLDGTSAFHNETCVSLVFGR
jgi:hypothetical protein